MAETATLAKTAPQKIEHFDLAIVAAGTCGLVARARRRAFEPKAVTPPEILAKACYGI